jgi:hypothetical protein
LRYFRLMSGNGGGEAAIATAKPHEIFKPSHQMDRRVSCNDSDIA